MKLWLIWKIFSQTKRSLKNQVQYHLSLHSVHVICFFIISLKIKQHFFRDMVLHLMFYEFLSRAKYVSYQPQLHSSTSTCQDCWRVEGANYSANLYCKMYYYFTVYHVVLGRIRNKTMEKNLRQLLWLTINFEQEGIRRKGAWFFPDHFCSLNNWAKQNGIRKSGGRKGIWFKWLRTFSYFQKLEVLA